MISLFLLSNASHLDHNHDNAASTECKTFDIQTGKCLDSDEVKILPDLNHHSHEHTGSGLLPCTIQNNQISDQNKKGNLPRQQINLVPYPNELTIHNGVFLFHDDLMFFTNCSEEKELFLRYMGSEFKLLPYYKFIDKNGINLLIDENLEINEEGYKLVITADSITIRAPKAAGLFYGLQTIIQLRDLNPVSGEIPCLEISDAPAFKYRGFHFDVSRHFYSKEFVMKQLDLMCHFKINRMHFHLVDAGGWRIEIKQYPELTRQTAFRNESRWRIWWKSGHRFCLKDDPNAYGGYYTQEDMNEIIKYAQDRFITIIPEIEMPGHNNELLVPYPEYSCSGKPYVDPDLCIGNPDSLTLMENILVEIMDLFPSEYIHIGGDEAVMSEWKTCPKCQALMQQEGFTQLEQLQSYFIKKIDEFITSKNRKMIGWDEILKGGLAPGTAVMSWTGEQGGITAATSGHYVVMSPSAFCYLDHFQDHPISQPDAIGGYVTLSVIYNYNPIPAQLDPQYHKYIMGVQGNLWTEHVYSPDQVEYMFYPRMFAIAESGWTKNELKDFEGFKGRIDRVLPWIEKKGYHPYRYDFGIGERMESREQIQHKALGKTVNYYTAWHPTYPAQGAATLTDGVRGTYFYNDWKWQGFFFQPNQPTFDVEVDMGETTSISEIFLDFYRMDSVMIYWPRAVVFSVSDDKENYDPIYTENNEWSNTPGYGFHRAKWNGKASGRYIRVTAYCYEDKGQWLFPDEIVIN